MNSAKVKPVAVYMIISVRVIDRLFTHDLLILMISNNEHALAGGMKRLTVPASCIGIAASVIRSILVNGKGAATVSGLVRARCCCGQEGRGVRGTYNGYGEMVFHRGPAVVAHGGQAGGVGRMIGAPLRLVDTKILEAVDRIPPACFTNAVYP